MKDWEDRTELDQLAQIYSDQYKDAYGSRPRGAGHPETVEEYKKEMDYLGEIIHRQIKCFNAVSMLFHIMRFYIIRFARLLICKS